MLSGPMQYFFNRYLFYIFYNSYGHKKNSISFYIEWLFSLISGENVLKKDSNRWSEL